MFRVLTILFLSASSVIYSQKISFSNETDLYEILINVKLLDSESKLPISFAEVFFPNKNIGAISDENGDIFLNFLESKVNDTDSLKIISQGYKTISTTAKVFYQFLKNTDEIYLSKTPETISENNVSTNNYLYGKVFSTRGPIQGATIKVKNSFVESKSDFEGFFRIKAKIDDIIVVNFLGMIEEQFFVTNFDDKYVLLKSENQILDEVNLSVEIEKDSLVDTGYGKKNKKSVGFSTSSISYDEFPSGARNIIDIIRGKFNNVQISSNYGSVGGEQKVFVRGGTLSFNNVASALFDVEGAVYSEVPDFLTPDEIESITLLRSIGATNRYGSQGRGGVFLIKLKSFSKSVEKKINSLMVKGNDYNEQVSKLDFSDFRSSYIIQFQNAKTTSDAKKIFNELKDDLYKTSVPFYIDSYDYFKKLDKDFALSILKELSIEAKDSPKILKAIAYKLEESGIYDEAKSIYKRLLKIRPFDEQSYRDMAFIYELCNQYFFAADIYEKIFNEKIKNITMLGLEKTIVNEATSLYVKYKDQLNLNLFPTNKIKTYLAENEWKNFGYDYRIVFDWTDPATEFNIQFVSPKNKYYNWGHTLIDDKGRLEDEQKYGYNTGEFIIDGSKKGQWIINIENYSFQDELSPTYLKYTVYKNYGRPNEIKKTSVIDLSRINNKKTLDILEYQN